MRTGQLLAYFDITQLSYRDVGLDTGMRSDARLLLIFFDGYSPIHQMSAYPFTADALLISCLSSGLGTAGLRL